ncbi:MAG TPA: homoserine dehydrogenase [Clostridiales bacterium]|nr:homoserine dehydrogenase [Clostridiales bacterium]
MMDIAILGYGVVGSGVAEVIRKNGQSIADRAGEQIRVKKILDIRDFPDSPDRELMTKDPEEIFGDPEIKIVVETIGGTGAAQEFTKRALSAGKHVVTSNKELVAVHGPELLKLAADNGVSYLFEASVGGGIPIIRPLSQCLAANIINGITGILNGTTNYILTKMRRENCSFEEALRNAQQNGYAEADPTADVEGHDTCRKIAILSSIAYNEYVDCSRIHTEGISGITLADMLYADAMNSVIKLIAVSRREGDRIFARVSPAVVSKEHPLAGVEDVFNAIVVSGDAIGDAMFYGRGAGKLPTASAVVADVIDIVKHNERTKMVWQRRETDNMVPFGESVTRCLVRAAVRDRSDAAADIAKIFGHVEYINADIKGIDNELAFTTSKMTESSLSERIDGLKSMKSVKEVVNVIRILEP